MQIAVFCGSHPPLRRRPILSLALRSVQRYLSDDTRAEARAQLVKWFGEG